MVAKNREFDIVIYGATGYTGQYVIEELAISSKSTNLKWAVAGRNANKLQQSLRLVQEYLGEDYDILKTSIIEADSLDDSTIQNMCKRARLILNCVGPYKLFGEVVVSACAENGTHHLDLSGEVDYLETTQAKYFNTARQNKCYIVQSCGFDSIPSDYGISLLKKKIPGDLNSVEYYAQIKTGNEGRSTNIGTFHSAVLSALDLLKTSDYDKMLKEQVFKKEMPKSKYTLSKRFPPLFYSGDVKSWCLWFIGPDERILRRSQKFRWEYLNDRPVQSQGYIQMSNFFYGLCYILFAGIFGVMSLTSFTRNLLIKYPGFFTAGAFSTEGPTRKQVLAGSTIFTLFGSGWKERLSDASDQHVNEPDAKLKLTITGPEPAYALTSMCFVQAGLTVLMDEDKLPAEGGVLTPGVAFENTDLFQRLEKRGMKFQFETLL